MQVNAVCTDFAQHATVVLQDQYWGEIALSSDDGGKVRPAFAAARHAGLRARALPSVAAGPIALSD
jgi:hypothetical protein